MDKLLIAVIILTAIGLLCAVLLVIAGKVMAVPVDETFEKVRACLPGANCGACGYAGCDGYADALAKGKTRNCALCVPGAAKVAGEVAAVMGLEAGSVEKKVAFITCRGTCENTGDKFEYDGIGSCAAAELFYAGPGQCTFGCMGFGDCAAVCDQGAICIENGMAHINPALCIGCGKCAKACPNQLIDIIPANVPVYVTCGNREKGAMTRKRCKVGCIGCKKCEKICEAGAITVENNLAKIDYTKCTGCGKCAENCPSGCILVRK